MVQGLVRQASPAVIGVQFDISDPAAVVFSRSSYQAIADGLPVDVATVETRRVMFAAGNEVEWAARVRYLRSPDSRVFTMSQVSETEHLAQEEARRMAREDAECNVRQEAEQPTLEKQARTTGEVGHLATTRDVMLMRLRMLAGQPAYLLACR
jgi:hypothetical protein